MARLDLEILLVDRSNGFCGYASNAVAVDKGSAWHASVVSSSTSRSLGPCCYVIRGPFWRRAHGIRSDGPDCQERHSISTFLSSARMCSRYLIGLTRGTSDSKS